MKLLLITSIFALSGCGSVDSAVKAASAASANGQTATATPETTSTAGGSLALSEPTATSSTGVAKIRVQVTNPVACASRPNKGRMGPYGRSPDGRDDQDDHDGGRGPGKAHQGDSRRGPPPRSQDQGGQSQGAALDDAAPSTDVATSTDTATSTDSSAGTDVVTPPAANVSRPDQCMVKDVESTYETGAKLTVDGIADGEYTVTVILEDADGKALEEGSAAKVVITTGQVAGADITLAPVTAAGTGSVAITVHEAPVAAAN